MSRHEPTKSLLHRCHRCGMATTGTLGAGPQAGRATRQVGAARDRQCDLLFVTHGVFVAVVAPRLSALADGLLLLRAVAQVSVHLSDLSNC